MASDTKECPSCALGGVDTDADVCPYCGYEFPPQNPHLPWYVALFLILMLIWLFW